MTKLTVEPMNESNIKKGNDCEHLRRLQEMEEFEIVLGLRKLVQCYEYTCALGYTVVDCPMPARVCKMKIETDNNCSDLASIGLIELGTRDVNVVFGDEDEMGGDFDIGLDEFDDGEDWV
jgi:hypothetical protein